MFSFIVHIEREHPTEWAIHTTNGARCRAYNQEYVKFDANITGAIEKMETWYCKTQVDAELLAGELSRKRPGNRVYICQTSHVYQTPVGTPVVSVVSDKGMLPK